jgi:hypothetical protein
MYAFFREGLFSGAWDWRNKVFGSLLLLAENYIQQLRTKTQRHEGIRAHKEIHDSLQLADPFALPAAAPGSRRAAL